MAPFWPRDPSATNPSRSTFPKIPHRQTKKQMQRKRIVIILMNGNAPTTNDSSNLQHYAPKKSNQEAHCQNTMRKPARHTYSKRASLAKTCKTQPNHITMSFKFAKIHRRHASHELTAATWGQIHCGVNDTNVQEQAQAEQRFWNLKRKGQTEKRSLLRAHAESYMSNACSPARCAF